MAGLYGVTGTGAYLRRLLNQSPKNRGKVPDRSSESVVGGAERFVAQPDHPRFSLDGLSKGYKPIMEASNFRFQFEHAVTSRSAFLADPVRTAERRRVAGPESVLEFLLADVAINHALEINTVHQES
jgi:hypothetical protein